MNNALYMLLGLIFLIMGFITGWCFSNDIIVGITAIIPDAAAIIVAYVNEEDLLVLFCF